MDGLSVRSVSLQTSLCKYDDLSSQREGSHTYLAQIAIRLRLTSGFPSATTTAWISLMSSFSSVVFRLKKSQQPSLSQFMKKESAQSVPQVITHKLKFLVTVREKGTKMKSDEYGNARVSHPILVPPSGPNRLSKLCKHAHLGVGT